MFDCFGKPILVGDILIPKGDLSASGHRVIAVHYDEVVLQSIRCAFSPPWTRTQEQLDRCVTDKGGWQVKPVPQPVVPRCGTG